MDTDYSSSGKKLTYEDVAECAQKFLTECPVVVLGSGATIPHGLPSMPGLAESLLKIIKDTTPAWGKFEQQLGESKNLEQTLNNIVLPAETVTILIQKTWELVSAKDLYFYQRLLQGDTPFPLADMFKYLLRTADAHLRVVTTNYDRVAEYAANHVKAYASTGMTPGWLQRFVPDSLKMKHSPWYEGVVKILKVHGSLDWFRNATNATDDVVSVPLSPTIPLNLHPLVVTPGTSKDREAHKDPFRTIITAADAVLREATCYVCVGYGFNDEHMQAILVNRVKQDDISLLVVTKKLTDQIHRQFLDTPPKKFLFLEKADGGTKAYTPDYPNGSLIDGVSVWQLNKFMDMIEGKK